MKQNSTKNWLKGTGKFLALCCALFAGTATYAQAPANDECTGAVSLPVNTNGICTQTAGTTIAATTSTQSMPCATNTNPDVWYTFTAANTQQTITLSSFSSLAFADVGVYSGICPTGLTLLSCTPTAGTVTATGLTVGTMYYLRVRTPAQNFNVCVGAPPPPLANDECAGAISVPVNSDTTCTQTVAATMVGSSPSTNAMTCLPTGAWSDVWFSFTAGSTVHRISTPPFTSANSVMVVYGGSCSGLTQVYCGAPNSLVSGLTAGTTYYVRINSSLSNSTFNICINTPILPANDECAGAISVPVNSDTACTQTVAGTSANATPSTNAMTCFPVGFYGDVWYSFVAGAANHKISTTTAAALVVYSGSCGTLTEVHCGAAGDTVSNLVAGNTYYARLIIPTSTSFDICITTVPPPAPNNDECAGAIMAPVNTGTTCTQTVAGSTIGKTQSIVSMSCSSDPTTPDVWYTFTATNTQHTITLSDFTNSIQTADIAVYSGSCGALTQLSCTSATTTSTVSGLTIGTTYYLLVRITYQDFTVCITTPPPPGPANDECAGAIPVPVNADATCTQTTAGTTIGATESAESMPCATNFNPDVWYTFTATNTDQVITLSDFSTTNTFANIGVYSGTCSSLVQLSCSVGVMSTTVTGLTVGTTYYLRVRTPAQDFTVCISAPLPPITNDECAGAVSVPVNADATCTQTLAATMVGATASSDPLSCFTTGTLPDVWFTFTASGSSHNISTPPFTVSDSRMAVYSGNCGGLTEVYCGNPNATVTGLTAGSTYYVRILSITTSAFSVCITIPTPPGPANDECAGAIDITNGTAIAGNTATATQSLPPASCDAVGTVANDLWYSFTTGNTGETVNLNVSGGSSTFPNVVMEIFDGTCSTLNSVACATDLMGVSYAFTAAPNTTYYTRMYTDDGSAYDYDIQATSTPLPVTMDKLKGHLEAGSKAMLEWTTYSEQLNKGFDIMRSEDGRAFQSVGWVLSMAENGNSTQPLAYQFKDQQPVNGKAFYQLRQVDMDGKTTLSNIVALSAENAGENTMMLVYPNPAKDVLHINIAGMNNLNGNVTITDIMGKTVLTQTLLSATETINIAALPAGTYFVKYTNSAASAIQKIVKK